MDLTNAPTVAEFVKCNRSTKVWLCPSLVSNGKISNPSYLSGIECTGTTIPDNLKDKKVRHSFKEEGFECIIWENDEDTSFMEEMWYSSPETNLE